MDNPGNTSSTSGGTTRDNINKSGNTQPPQKSGGTLGLNPIPKPDPTKPPVTTNPSPIPGTISSPPGGNNGGTLGQPPIPNPGGGGPTGGGGNPGGGNTGGLPPTDGGPPPPDGGGGCPCPAGDGSGGGPTGSGVTPGCPPSPRLCRKHDGTIIDKDSGTTYEIGRGGQVYLFQDQPGCEQSIDPSSLPYCDDISCSTPQPSPEDKAGQCCKEAFQAIADAMKEVAKALDKKFELTQEMIDQWLDYIAKKIKDRIIPPAKTCSECCKRIELGLATKAECAMVAANCTCQDCVDSCESFNEGECCKSCGSTNCKCKEGKCVGDDKPQPDKWTAWCDYTTGVHLSTNDGKQPGIAGNWTNLGTFDTFEQSDAVSCNISEPSTGGGTLPGGGPPLPPVKLPSGNMQGVCESQRYRSEIAAQNFLSQIPAANVEADIIAGVRTAVSAMSAAAGNVPGMAAGALTGIAQTVGRVWMLDTAANILASASGQSPTVIYPAMRTLTTIGIAEELAGVSLPQLHVGIEYAINAATRPRIYTPEQALAAGLSGRIPMADVDRYFAAAGYCEEVSRGMIQAGKSKPGVNDLARMRRRGMVTEDEYTTLVTNLGYIDEEWPERLFKLTEVLPGPSDLIQFMKRDTDDQNIVDRFKLDTDFTDKFNDKLKDWAGQVGVSDEVMKYHWRSHWDIPSPTALAEMYRRLRYADVAEGTRVTEDDVRTALEQQDILPFWIDKYMALMHPPLGRIDLRRSYQNGTLTDDEVKRGLGELGYSDDNVDKLFKFMQRLKEQGASNHRAIKRWVALLADRSQVQSDMQDDGYTSDQIDKALETASPRLISTIWSKTYVAGEISEIDFRNLLTGHGVTGDSVDQIVNLLSYRIKDTDSVKAYSAGILTRQSALERMTNRGMQPSAAQKMLDDADDAFNAAQAARCAANVKSRYIRGAIDADDAKQKLLVNGLAGEWADRLIGKWKCELSSKDKAVSADKICSFLANGSLGFDEAKLRLTRIGYAEPDALLLLGDCSDRIATQQAKAEAKRQAEVDRSKQKAEATARRNEARANALVKQAEVARKAKNTLRQTRQTQELTTLKNLIGKCNCSNGQAVLTYNQNKDRIMSQLGLTIDEANRVLLKSSEIWADGDPASYTSLVDDLALALSMDEAEALTPEP